MQSLQYNLNQAGLRSSPISRRELTLRYSVSTLQGLVATFNVNPSITLRQVRDHGLFIEITGIGFTPNGVGKLNYSAFTPPEPMDGVPTYFQSGFLPEAEPIISIGERGGFVHQFRQPSLEGEFHIDVRVTDVTSGLPAKADGVFI